MYRCEVCYNVSRPGQHLLRHTLYRNVPHRQVERKVMTGYGLRTTTVEEPPRKEIAREVALCQQCFDAVSLGIPFEKIVRDGGVVVTQPPVVVSETENSDKVVAVQGTNRIKALNSLNGSPRPTKKKV